MRILSKCVSAWKPKQLGWNVVILFTHVYICGLTFLPNCWNSDTLENLRELSQISAECLFVICSIHSAAPLFFRVSGSLGFEGPHHQTTSPCLSDVLFWQSLSVWVQMFKDFQKIPIMSHQNIFPKVFFCQLNHELGLVTFFLSPFDSSMTRMSFCVLGLILGGSPLFMGFFMSDWQISLCFSGVQTLQKCLLRSLLHWNMSVLEYL